ncbi:MAG: EF-P lysine aminoacylase GenX [Deltaproteobacteria bacterium]|nr:EF-P lysine aminoacylase GenX [Deltaproteobacteria bacterium]
MALDPAGLERRSRVLRALRRWFEARGYLEVPTPSLVASPAMEEHLFAIAAGQGFLRTSPEFALKRVVAAGLPRVYEIGPCFRDRESGPWHGTEFLMAEWYRAGAALTDLMDELEAMLALAASALGVAAPTWRRTTVRALFLEHTGLDLATATPAQIYPHATEDWDTAFFRRWLEDVEPRFGAGGLIVSDWPASQAALAQVRTDGEWPRACRFEAYLDGVELANAFQELTDSAEQARRFAHANQARAEAGEAPHPVDQALVDAVGRMPRTAGIAMGVDRVVAALCGWDGIGPGRVPGGV